MNGQDKERTTNTFPFHRDAYLDVTQTAQEDMPDCPFCGFPSLPYMAHHKRLYCKCDSCSGIFRSPACRLDDASEKKRYLQHSNDTTDQGYRSFVSPGLKYTAG